MFADEGAGGALPHYCSAALADWIARVLVLCGMRQAEADIGARHMVRSSLRGAEHGGLACLPDAIRSLRSGQTNPRARPRTSLGLGYLYCDGDGGLGSVAAAAAMNAALRQAAETPVVACIVSNSSSVDSLGLAVLRAGEEGMIALACHCAPASGGAPGAGNWALAYSLPVPGGAPLVADLATGGPLAALAMLVDCLAASLDSADLLAGGAGTAGSQARSGSFILVLNPDLINGRDAFAEHQRNRSWPAEAGAGHASYPGQAEAACEATRRIAGIPIEEKLLGQLRAAGDLLACPFDARPSS